MPYRVQNCREIGLAVSATRGIWTRFNCIRFPADAKLAIICRQQQRGPAAGGLWSLPLAHGNRHAGGGLRGADAALACTRGGQALLSPLLPLLLSLLLQLRLPAHGTDWSGCFDELPLAAGILAATLQTLPVESPLAGCAGSALRSCHRLLGLRRGAGGDGAPPHAAAVHHSPRPAAPGECGVRFISVDCTVHTCTHLCSGAFEL